MAETKEKAVKAPAQAPTAQTNSTTSIIQPPQNNVNMPPTSSTFKKRKGQRLIVMESSVRTLAVKCYDEQLPNGLDHFVECVKGTDSKQYQIVAVRHDRDVITDNIWECPLEKAHWHILIRVLNNKNKRVRQLLNMLGIQFRQGVDDLMWANGGVETCSCFDKYVTYIFHRTPEAIRDGKERYELEEAVSNLNEREIELLMEGYIRVSEDVPRPTYDDFINLDTKARELGKQLRDFEEWYNNLSFAIRSSSRIRTVKETYYSGLKEGVEEAQKNPIVRTCIFIKGKANTGKTYASIKAMEKLGKKTLSISGGQTGKFDKLQCSHQAIVVDDDTVPTLLNLSDNYICQLYKRNSNNPAWCGDTLIITSNLDFDQYLDKCGFKDLGDWYGGVIVKPSATYEALKSRFFICEVVYDSKTSKNVLQCNSPSTRGSKEEQTIRCINFANIQRLINESLGEYKPALDNIANMFNLNPHMESTKITPPRTVEEALDYLKARNENLNNPTNVCPRFRECGHYSEASCFWCVNEDYFIDKNDMKGNS